MKYFWYFFANNNWHNGGNSTEQYARTVSISPSIYIHGAKSRKIESYNQLQIIPQKEKFVYQALDEKVEGQKIAMFARPTKLFLNYMQLAKDKGIKTIYRAVDDWQLWENNDWYSRELELKFVQLADLAVATSAKVAKEFGVPRVPNGCQKIKNKEFNSSPVVGFLGDLDNQVSSAKVDLDLIVYLAKMFPEIQFKLVGSRQEWKIFPSNVSVLPYLKWEEANAFLEKIDIGLIPYRGKDIGGVQPIKSWEYMGYGIPQIATRGLDMPEHESVYLYKSYEDCAGLLASIQIENIKKESIIEFARQNTWQKRIDILLEWIK